VRGYRGSYRCVLGALCGLLFVQCIADNETPMGLEGVVTTGGPVIEFDLEERPFPNIPFPNDIATRRDPTSPTGLRVNVSELGATRAEVRVRKAINRSTGFGVYSPITVSFDAPLDVERIIERHHDDVPDFSDDVVYLVNIDPKSPNYGKLELLDLGRGNYPITLANPAGYFLNDTRSMGTNLLFETVREGSDETSEFEPMLDRDDDGTLDEPNTRRPDDDVWDFGAVLDFYERETHTLIMRPVHTLEPGTRYAVVLTRDLIGEEGKPVQSPFGGINHASQTRELERLRTILPQHFPQRFDERLEDVQFAWTFTTQVPTQELEVIRAGLYGHGVLARLADEFPARLHMLHAVRGSQAPNPMTFDLGAILPIILTVAAQEAGAEGARVIEEAFGEIDYLVSGTFLSPYFLVDKGHLGDRDADAALGPKATPVDDDESFQIDVVTGEAVYSIGEVPFMCTVPRARAGRPAPFPTIIYSHAIGSTRLEILVFAGAMAKFGLATCTIDNVGHGLAIPSEYDRLIQQLANSRGLPNLAGVLNHHRARDVTNNGVPDPGGDYFTSDMLHSRDMMRQTTIDQLQLVRILRTFDGQLRFPDGIDETDPFIRHRRELVAGWDQSGDGVAELAGDFNGDGTIDLGGAGPYVAWGTSLGGIQTSILAAIEPTIIAAASNAGGGGLTDIAARSTISNVRAGVVLRMLGPVLIGRPYVNSNQVPTGRTRLDWLVPSADSAVAVHFADLDDMEDGDRIVLRNLAKAYNPVVPVEDQSNHALVREGRFRLSVAADARSSMTRRAALGFDASVSLIEELMGCKVSAQCGEQTCPDQNYCTPDGRCAPIGRCLVDFDLDRALEDPSVREQVLLRTMWNPAGFGDPLVIEIYDAEGQLKQTIDTFPQHMVFENILYPQGAPLAALIEGWGLKRQTPKFRKFIGIAQGIAEAADPAVYAPHYFLRPLEFPYEQERYRVGGTNFFQVGTLGDQTVPINAGLSVARVAGIIDTHHLDDRYGKTQNNFLIDNFVYEGIPWRNRIEGYPNNLFDPDDLDEGRYRNPSNPSQADAKPRAERPLRASVETPYGLSVLRLPYIRPTGEHTFNAPTPTAAFDIHTFMTNQVGWFLVTGGQEITDDHCLEKMMMPDCPFFDLEGFVRPSLH
jgi:hypothetical protein